MSARARLGAALELGLAFAVVTSDAGAHEVVKRGKTIDFADLASDTNHVNEAYVGRLFLPYEARGAPRTPRPLLVFLHGVNMDHSRHRFAGGKPSEPDIRVLVGEMVARGLVPPVIVGAPSTQVACEMPVTMWPEFDLDRFVERAARELRGQATLDLDRVVLVSHSGGGCNPRGGLFTALANSTLSVRSVMAIDGCMSPDDARIAAAAPGDAHVFVTWQPYTWDRPYDAYASAFKAAATGATGLRVLEEHRPVRGSHVHNAMVEITLRKHLPTVLPPPEPARLAQLPTNDRRQARQPHPGAPVHQKIRARSGEKKDSSEHSSRCAQRPKKSARDGTPREKIALDLRPGPRLMVASSPRRPLPVVGNVGAHVGGRCGERGDTRLALRCPSGEIAFFGRVFRSVLGGGASGPGVRAWWWPDSQQQVGDDPAKISGRAASEAGWHGTVDGRQ